ncbi:hypothetical protein ACLKA6_013367 [Drosophila palustris]
MWKYIVRRILCCCCCIGHNSNAELARKAVSTLTLEIVIVDEDLDHNSPIDDNNMELNRVQTWPDLMLTELEQRVIEAEERAEEAEDKKATLTSTLALLLTLLTTTAPLSLDAAAAAHSQLASLSLSDA